MKSAAISAVSRCHVRYQSGSRHDGAALRIRQQFDAADPGSFCSQCLTGWQSVWYRCVAGPLLQLIVLPRATLGACAGNSLMERRAAGGDE
jgi:hypothetical protein